ncbi:MAG: phosphatase PAP2 family protein [Armatimonadota bacterium]|nr:phosphatase PAP2 family protein [Armatimonadota bacterium]
MQLIKFCFPAFVLCSIASGTNIIPIAPARADSSESKEARFATGTGFHLYVAAGTLLPLLEDGKEGAGHSLRTMESVGVGGLVEYSLKRLVREKRPRSNERTSFPSGHAMAAFEVATMQSHFHPHQAPLWYGGATLIAASRVQLHRHHVHDVLAGAALGYGISRLELSRRHGLVLSPFFRSRSDGRRMGLALATNF